MEILKKSFKYTTPTSPNHPCHPEDERFSLLEDQKQTLSSSSSTCSETMSGPVGGDASNTNDVIIKINTRANDPTPSSSTNHQLKSNNDENKHAAIAKHDIWKGSSYDFSSDIAMAAFAHKSKDFDFVTESPLSQQRSPLARIPEACPTDFEKVTTDQVRRRSNASGSPGRNGSPEEILVCSGNSSFKRRSSLLRTKTNSRLLDPPDMDRKTSRLLKSGVMSRGGEVEEEDPFFDEDLPEEYNTMRFSVLTVVEIVSLVLLIGALICTVTIKFLRKRTLFQLELWKWEVMILVLICGRLFSGWGIRIVVLLVERNFLLRKRVLYFVYGLRKAVQNCIWLTLVFVAWQSIFDKKLLKVTHGQVLPYVTKIWVCLLVATLIWLVKTLIVKVLASSFHVSTFFDRIQESLFNQYVVEALSGPPLVEILQEQEEEERVIAEVQKLQNAGAKLPADLKGSVLKSGRTIGTPRKSPLSNDGKTPRFSKSLSRKEEERGITIDHLHRLNQKNISAWNMKRLMNIVRKGALSTLDERLEDCNDDEASVEITSEKQAKMAAKKIFYNVAKPGSKVIQLEDLMRFMREDEALKTMHLFEGANEGKGISKKSLKNWVVNAFRERRALALSLNDTKTAVNKLHQMLNIVVAIIVVIIWLLILKLASTHFFIFISSQLLLVVFMFGNTCKTTFEAIIFLFVMHPFDVGDRVEIDEVQMVVEEINILTTVFLRYDNQKIFYPNSVLATKPISNYYRSPDMGDAIDFCIHISTSMEKIALMKERITRVVENRTDHWYPAPMVVMRDVEDMNRLKWSVWLSHTINFQDMGERWVRRALLVEEMVKIFRELDIEYRMLPHDVNVRGMPSLTSTRAPSNWSVCS